MIASTFQAVAIMLKERSTWDWFIDLSTPDYPQATADLLSVLSNVSGNFNFVKHRQLTYWKLSSCESSCIDGIAFHEQSSCTTQISSPLRKATTTLRCNSPYYQKTTINHDLHYIAWDNPPKQHPRYLSMTDFHNMVKSSAPFVRSIQAKIPSWIRST
ncbi:hypothetical protein MLD38_003078 [Melastoma candidum]|uniref:Uncharacterized protein n=1 Tax=Melastoma candidum TaxID=119954 RepID=A0ACB9S3E1_9MYRT|nr:hypothetical protein MLD38_003078 [Melastoma candidum]